MYLHVHINNSVQCSDIISMQSIYHICTVHIHLVYSDCDVDRCENGGTCVKQGVSYSCNCRFDYTGSLCETALSKIVYLYIWHVCSVAILLVWKCKVAH